MFWSPADWAWTGGLWDVLLPTWHFGMPLLAYKGRFDAGKAFALIEKYGVRNCFLSAFDDAFVMIEPFFDPGAGLGRAVARTSGVSHRAREFSSLSAEEVHLVVVAAHRVYIERYPERSGHLPRPSELRQVTL
jgi:hypothetical protein